MQVCACSKIPHWLWSEGGKETPMQALNADNMQPILIGCFIVDKLRVRNVQFPSLSQRTETYAQLNYKAQNIAMYVSVCKIARTSELRLLLAPLENFNKAI